MLLFTFHLQCYSKSSTVYLLTLKSFSGAFLEETAHFVSCTRPCWTTELELNLFGAAAIMKQNVDSFWIDCIWLEDRRRGFSSCVHRFAWEPGYTTFIQQEKSEGRIRWERLSPSLALLNSLSLSPPECQLILPSSHRSPSWIQHLNGWWSASAARNFPPLSAGQRWWRRLACGENADLHLKSSHSLSIIFL